MLKRQVKNKYSDIVSEDQDKSACIKKLKPDINLIHWMKMLVASDDMDVVCGDLTMICLCRAAGCKEIMIVKRCSNNDELCTKCTRTRES